MSEVKAFEAEKTVGTGGHEIDVVINIGALKSGDYKMVRRDIEAVATVKHLRRNLTAKAIIETPYLAHGEKIAACELAKDAGADFVKTSTGLVGGATVEDTRLMRETVGQDIGVKAAGGIRTFQQALPMIEAGANRIGTSTSVAITEGFPE